VALSNAIGDFVIGESAIEAGTDSTDLASLINDGLLDKVIPSYLYWQYRDDDDLQAFVDAQNALAQLFINWFRSLNLPIYTKDPVSHTLLDWVGTGLYGYPRPVLASGRQTMRGLLNTWRPNTIRVNQREVTGQFTPRHVSDDLYRRMITWHFYKGDGRQLTIRALKRRIARFLTGENGQNLTIDQTYQISVSFGLCCQINITLRRYISGVRRAIRPNTFRPGTMRANQIEVSAVAIYQPFEFGQQFKEAVDQGLLEMPFQYTCVITVQ
jgi:hypothetical protein